MQSRRLQAKGALPLAMIFRPLSVRHGTFNGKGCVVRVYTGLAVIDVEKNGFAAIGLMPGLSMEELVTLSGVAIRDGRARAAD